MILGLQLADQSRPTDRVDVRLNHPFEITKDGIVVVRDVARFYGQYVLPSGMSDADRLRFSTMVKNMIAHAVITGYVTSRDPYY